MLKNRTSEFDQFCQITKRSSLTHQKMDEWWADEIFTDEYSEESPEDLDNEGDIKNLKSLLKCFE